MSQNIDLSGPVAAEALRIADGLLREWRDPSPVPNPATPEGMQWYLMRGRTIGLLAEAILGAFQLAVAEANRDLMKRALKEQDDAADSSDL